MQHHSFAFVKPLALISLMAVACGGEDSSMPMNPGPQTHVVQALSNNTFSPANLNIRAGDTVRWENSGGGNHNVAANDGSFRCAAGCDAEGGNGDPSTANWQFSIVFDNPGTVDYNCEVHVGIGMTGRVVVQ